MQPEVGTRGNMINKQIQVTSQAYKLGCKTEAMSGVLLAGSRIGVLLGNLYGQTSNRPFSDQLPSGKVTAAKLLVKAYRQNQKSNDE